MARIFSVVLAIAAGVPPEGVSLNPWPDAEPVGVGRHHLHVERGHAELLGHLLGVLALPAVRARGEAEHHLAGRVDAQKDRSIGLVRHYRFSSSSGVADDARRWRS